MPTEKDEADEDVADDSPTNMETKKDDKVVDVEHHEEESEDERVSNGNCVIE